MSPRFGLILSAVLAIAVVPAASPAQLTGAPAASSAQSTASAPSHLVEGTRVRVSTVHRRDPITGVVVSHSADSLVMRSDKDSATMTLPTAQVSRVDISRGRRTQKLKGATIGFLSGAGIGALVGYATYEPSCGSEGWICFDFGPEFEAAAAASLFGLVGAITGTLVGNREREQWRPFSGSLGRDARLGIAPAGGGIALTASLRF